MGCLVGLAVGDALGAPVEFAERGTFEPVVGYRAGGPFNLEAGEWTDDTAMARGLAASLREKGYMDHVDVMVRWCNWQAQGLYSVNGRCFDIGGRTATALDTFRETGAHSAYSASALGCGGIMRMAPAAVYGALTGNMRVCVRQSALTHNNQEANAVAKKLGQLLAGFVWGMRSKAVDGRVVVPEVFGGTAVDCFDLAWAAFRLSRDFSGCVLRAANFGGDADSVAAVAGQLAGAYFGLSEIRRSGLLDGLAMGDTLLGEAEEFVDTFMKSDWVW